MSRQVSRKAIFHPTHVVKGNANIDKETEGLRARPMGKKIKSKWISLFYLHALSPPCSLSFSCETPNMSPLSSKVASIKQAFSSRSALIKALETKESAHGLDRNPWTNADLDISPPEDWTWTWRSYAAFWWSYGFSTGVWTVGSSLIAVGLNSWQGTISPSQVTFFIFSISKLTIRYSYNMHLHLPPPRRHRYGHALPQRSSLPFRLSCLVTHPMGYARRPLSRLCAYARRHSLEWNPAHSRWIFHLRSSVLHHRKAVYEYA